MKRQFFREFSRVKDILRSDQRVSDLKMYSEQNYLCLDALERYLYSYRWCRKERERILLQEMDSRMRPIAVARENGISYDTYRSMSSRVSNRLYEEIGRDFVDVILGKSTKDQNWLIEMCITRTEVFNVVEVLPDYLLSRLEAMTKTVSVEIDENFGLNSSRALVFQFLEDSMVQTALTRLSLLDEESVVQCYRILTEKKYFSLRMKALSYMKKFNDKDALKQMEDNMYMRLEKKVLVSKKEYEEFLRYKKCGIIA